MAMAEATMTELPRDAAAMAKLVANAVASARSRAFSGHSEQMLLWLALAPVWPRPYIEAGFPSTSGMATGAAAVNAVENAAKAGLASKREEGTPIYWMTRAQTASVLSYVSERRSGALSFLPDLSKAAQAMRRASSNAPLSEGLERWCRLGEAGPSEENIAAILDGEIETAIKTAEDEQAVVCPAARRWIETAAEIAEFATGDLRVSLLRAERRFELFHRRANDRRHLANFLPREKQIAAFNELMDGPDDAWALHYVGGGGTGKTMLIRKITVDLARERELAVARIDFDHLNPQYPTRAPALLLAALAEELKLYERTTPSGFKNFFEAARTVHESVDARGGANDDQATLAAVGPALRAFIDALIKLERRPLLILDTCEELAKMQPGIDMPRNVAMTLSLLERIHDEVRALRVVFSGRRPLATAGIGWTSPGSKMPPRNYLLLHLVSGFDRKESLDLLKTFREDDKGVDRLLFTRILTASPWSDDAFTAKFRIDGVAAAADDDLYNPFDLNMYASMATGGMLSEESGRHAYVSERIIDRVPSLRPVLPAIVRLGSFDRQLIEQLRGGESVDAAALADEAGEQHWISQVAAQDDADEPRWVVGRRDRQKLLEYYAEVEPDPLAKWDRQLAGILPAVTLTRPWGRLDIEMFDAVLHVLQQDVTKTLEWWAKVEDRIARDAQWDWAQRMTATLLATESETEEGTVQKIPDPLLRSSIQATGAAAMARMGRTDQRETWQHVFETIADVQGQAADFLRRRACAALVSELQWSAGPLPEVVNQLPGLLTRRPVSHIQEERELAAEVALLEGAVEILERAAADPSGELRSEVTEAIELLLEQRYDPSAYPWPVASNRGLERFSASLLARVAVLRGDPLEAGRLFRLSIAFSLDDIEAQQRPAPSLDWTPPADLATRLLLEAIRGFALRFNISAFPGLTPRPGDTLDSDRLASAIVIVSRASHAADDAPAPSVRRRDLTGAPCNAHRAIPSYLSTQIEYLAADGAVRDALALFRDAMKQAEQSANVLDQNDLARVQARLICRYRLFDLGEKPHSPIFDNDGFEETELAIRYSALAGEQWVPKRAVSQESYILARQGTLILPSMQPAVEADSTFAQVWQSIGRGVYEFGRDGLRADSPELQRALEWVEAPRREPLEAIRVLVRLCNIGGGTFSQQFDELGQRAGIVRAAEVIVEECELAAMTQSLVSTVPLSIATGWFEKCGSRFGPFRANVIASMARETTMTGARILESMRGLPGFPNPEDVMLALGSSRHFVELRRTLDDTDATLRPWVLRGVAACFALAGESASRMARHGFETWLATKDHSSTDLLLISKAARLQPTRPSALSGLGVMAIQALSAAFGLALISGFIALIWSTSSWITGLPASARIAAAAIILLAIIGGTIRASTREPTLGLVLLVPSWSLLYYLAMKIPGAVALFGARGSFFSILSFNLIWGLLGFLASQGSRWIALRDALRARTAYRLRFPPGGERMELRSPFGTSSAPIVKWTPDRAARYVLLRNTLSEETTDMLDRWSSQAARKPLPVQIDLPDDENARICWEAVIDSTLFSEEARAQPVDLFRTIALRRRMSVLSPSRTVRVLGLSGVDPAWGRLEGRRGFEYVAGDDPRSAAIIHVSGTPVVVREEVRLDIGADTDAASSRVSVLDTGFARNSSANCCIIQGRQSGSRVRTDTDREVAGRLRQFGAQVFSEGVPVVLVIPPMPLHLASMTLITIADRLADKKLSSHDEWLLLVGDLRRQITDFGLRDPAFPFDTAVELAYDICVYLNERIPDLRPGSWWRRFFQ
jgi:hypothetical protein